MRKTLKKRLPIALILGVILLYYSVQSLFQTPQYRTENIQTIDTLTVNKIRSIYQEAQLAQQMNFDLFQKAMIGFYHIEHLKFKDKIVITDYSKPSTEKRFYVVDLEKKKLLYHTWVAHGKNSGENLATNFSNVQDSKKSSLGFFLTAETYQGKNGFSLRLDGIEKNINHNARKRNIVIHGADYVSQEFIHTEGRLGRSWGCPALPNTLSKEIIKNISGGRCLFVYAPDERYLSRSHYILKNKR